MADQRKLCSSCHNVYARAGFFPGSLSEDCILVINKMTINKHTYDTIKEYWEYRLKTNEEMKFDCPGYNRTTI